MATNDPPEFSVVFKGETMEPIADVAPEGDVTFVLINESDQPHDFAIVEVESDADDRSRRSIRLEPNDPTFIGDISDVESGGSETATYRLERGRYVLISNTPGEHLGLALFQLTVQPVEGE